MRARFSILLLAVIAFTGCTVVSYDRVFPKLTWYWSKDAKAQRASHVEAEDLKAINNPTNFPNK